MTTAIAEPSPLVNMEQAAAALRDLHSAVLTHGITRLERYPWPGGWSSVYHEPGNVLRFMTRGSNAWQPSACASAYYAWLRASHHALWTLCRAFVLCEPVPVSALERLLTSARCHAWREAGLLTTVDGSYLSRVRATPWQGRLLWHDAPPAFRESFVFLGADSLTFARHLIRQGLVSPHVRYRRALDMCAGAGIHALMLARCADEVVGADVNPRAIAFASANAELQGIRHVSFVVSNLFAHVPQGPYDLIVSNTPFLFLPEELRARCVDGDGGHLGMELALRLLDAARPYVAESGRVVLHANAPVVGGRDRLLEALGARLEQQLWDVWLMPTHEFYDPSFHELYHAHGISRFITYVVVAQPSRRSRIRRRPLSPWRKAACAVRIATARGAGAGPS